MIIAMWVSMTFIGLIVTGVIENDKLQKGDPQRLINGMDYNGKICGIDTAVTAMNTSIADLPKAYYLPSGAPVCIEKCPTEDNFDEYICQYNKKQKVLDAVKAADENTKEATAAAMYMSYTTSMECMPVMATRDFLGYCVPEAAIAAATAAASAAMNAKIRKECQTTDTTVYPVEESDKFWKLSSAPVNCTAARKGIEISAAFLDPASEDGFFDRISADLYVTQGYIMGFGLGVAMVMGFVYLFCIRIPGVLSTLIWGILFLIFSCFAGLALYMYMTTQKWLAQATDTTYINSDGVEVTETNEGPHSAGEIAGMTYISYFFLGVAGVWAMFICCIRKRIILAIGCVKEAAKAMAAMPVITIYPVFQVLGVMIFLLPWCTYCTYLASSGTVKVACIKMSASGMMDQATNAYAMAEAASDGEQYEEESTCEQGDLLYKTMEYTNDTQLAGLYVQERMRATTHCASAAHLLTLARGALPGTCCSAGTGRASSSLLPGSSSSP